MKRTIVRLCMAIAVVGLAASCGGGGGDDEDKGYDFNGRWFTTLTVTASTSQIPVGRVYTHYLVANANGAVMTVRPENNLEPIFGATLSGVCDVDAETFAVNGNVVGVLNLRMNGNATSPSTMVGTYVVVATATGATTTMTFTTQLASRSIADSAGVTATPASVEDFSTLAK